VNDFVRAAEEDVDLLERSVVAKELKFLLSSDPRGYVFEELTRPRLRTFPLA
jgi:hypothetical protein